jgi:hypothetical protein
MKLKLATEGSTRGVLPCQLGDGLRLFENINPESIEPENKDVIESPGVTHLRF